MTDIVERQGACLCGGVKIHSKNMNTEVGACHCSMCRKWSGGPLMAIDCGTEVYFKGEENISVYDSSEWAERAFCKKCGSHLYYKLKQRNQFFVPVGLFENEKRFNLTHQVFIDKKPAYYSFANQTTDLTEAELFAKFSS